RSILTVALLFAPDRGRRSPALSVPLAQGQLHTSSPSSSRLAPEPPHPSSPSPSRLAAVPPPPSPCSPKPEAGIQLPSTAIWNRRGNLSALQSFTSNMMGGFHAELREAREKRRGQRRKEGESMEKANVEDKGKKINLNFSGALLKTGRSLRRPPSLPETLARIERRLLGPPAAGVAGCTLIRLRAQHHRGAGWSATATRIFWVSQIPAPPRIQRLHPTLHHHAQPDLQLGFMLDVGAIRIYAFGAASTICLQMHFIHLICSRLQCTHPNNFAMVFAACYGPLQVKG
ncbi:hypothetical protein EJB05_51781, partial [Eragrostis curvula]